MKPLSLLVFFALTAVAADGPISQADAKKLKNPIAFTSKSVGQGKSIFIRMCSSCHGMDGKSTLDVVADATDLTEPKAYKSGATEGEIFRSIRDGQGASMPSFKDQLKSEDEMWHLVNFIENLWPDTDRPKPKSSK